MPAAKDELDGREQAVPAVKAELDAREQAVKAVKAELDARGRAVPVASGPDPEKTEMYKREPVSTDKRNQARLPC